MRILVICDVLFPQTIGGAGRFARELGAGLERRGHTIHFLTRRVKADLQDDDATTYLPGGRLPFPGRHRKCFEECVRRFRPDVIHIHQPLAAWLCLPSTVEIPLVYTFHSSWPEEFIAKSSGLPISLRRIASRGLAAIEKQVLQRSSVITVLSEFSRRKVLELYGLPSIVVPGGVDIGHFRPHPVVPARDRIRLLTVRNLVPRMGIDELIRAMAQLPPHFYLDIAGDGPLRSTLNNLIRELKLEARVRLLGRVPDDALARLYSAADWFILPTASLEGFGLVILESLACGTPVLGTRVGAIPELLERLDPAWVINHGDAYSIASVIQSAAKTQPDRESIRQYAVDNHSWDSVAMQFEVLVRDIAP